MAARICFVPGRALLGLGLTLTAAACAAPQAGRNLHGPLGSPPAAVELAAFKQRIEAAHSAVHDLHAEVRLVSFGPQGRLRGRADVDLGRPDRLRYTLFGPHGGPLIVLACDGARLRGVDMQARRYVDGPADACQFDAWLAPLALHLDARGFVRLLLGELDVPPAAQWAPGAPPGMLALHWQRDTGQQIWAAFGQDDARLRLLRLCRSERLQAQVDVAARDAAGVPTRLHIEQPAAEGAASRHSELSLRDVTSTPVEMPDLFSLSPPAGFSVLETQTGVCAP